MVKNNINCKMHWRSFGLCAVVLWLSVVHINAAGDCRTPVIENGYFASKLNAFPHDTELHYACEEGYKPAIDDWWATVTCQSGQWSPEPLCIEKTSCFDPDIPNANYTRVPFTKNGSKLRIKCNNGYENKGQLATAVCENGEWTVLPVCQRRATWCEPPPQQPNALIINQAYQEIFPEDAEVEYRCKDGFEPAAHYTILPYCSKGEWHSVPSCKRKKPSQDGGHVTTESPNNSGSDNIRPMFTTIDKCGTPPTIANGEFLNDDNSNMYVIYQCKLYYKLQGNSKVMCYGTGSWTTPPTCIEDFCELNTARYNHLENTGVVFIKSETVVKLDCHDSRWRSARAQCKNRQLQLTECCLWGTHKAGLCGFISL